MEVVYRVFGSPTGRNVSAIVTASMVSTVIVFSLVRLVFQERQDKIIKSPTFTLLPHISALEIAALPYPPDALPGGRHVNSPVCSRPSPNFQVYNVDMNY